MARKTKITAQHTERFGEVAFESMKKYYNHNTGGYKIWLKKGAVKAFAGIDIYKLLDHNLKYVGAYHLLMNMINHDNIITRLDAHTHTHVAITSKSELYKALYLDRNSGPKFFSLLEEQKIIVKSTIPALTKAQKPYDIFYLNPLYAMTVKGEISVRTYFLFRDQLIPFLPAATREDLDALCEAQLNNKMEEETIEELTEEEQEGKLVELVFKDEMPHIYVIQDKACGNIDEYIEEYMAEYDELPSDLDLYFTPNRPFDDYNKRSNPAAKDITHFDNWFIDIDAGRDAAGNYFNDDEVGARKAEMLNVIKALPTNTAVVETRNGYHVYFTCYGVEKREIWQKLQNKLISLVSISDKAVKSVNHLMRVPFSVWIKPQSGIAPFKTQLVEAHDQQWDAKSFEKQLNACAPEIEKRCKVYTNMFNCGAPSNAKKATELTDSERTLTVEQSARFDDISTLDFNSFDIPAEPVYTDDVARYLREHVDMADFLCIENEKSFRDLFHDDQNPSASIYHNESGDRYVCSSASSPVDESGWSIIDIVCHVADCTPAKAIGYLAEVFNIHFKEAA